MSRRINIRVSAVGEIQVEADGYKGNGCEAATKAIEDALGRPTSRSRKADFWRQSQGCQNQQSLGEGGSIP